MDWIKIASAVFMVAMFIYLIPPRQTHGVQNSPKGSASDWMGYVIPMVAIVLFIVMLIKLV